MEKFEHPFPIDRKSAEGISNRELLLSCLEKITSANALSLMANPPAGFKHQDPHQIWVGRHTIVLARHNFLSKAKKPHTVEIYYKRDSPEGPMYLPIGNVRFRLVKKESYSRKGTRFSSMVPQGHELREYHDTDMEWFSQIPE